MTTSTTLRDPILCSDFSQFMNHLKQSRLIDDRIIHELNTTIPTQSFSEGVDIGNQCKTLHDMVIAEKIVEAQTSRNEAIHKCLDIQLKKTKELISQRDKDPEEYSIRKQLSREQSTMRLFQQELTVENIVKDRVKAAFHERCRNYYRADFPS